MWLFIALLISFAVMDQGLCLLVEGCYKECATTTITEIR